MQLWVHRFSPVSEHLAPIPRVHETAHQSAHSPELGLHAARAAPSSPPGIFTSTAPWQDPSQSHRATQGGLQSQPWEREEATLWLGSLMRDMVFGNRPEFPLWLSGPVAN